MAQRIARLAIIVFRFNLDHHNGGELDGKRFLAAATVDRMATDQLAPGTPFKGQVGKWVGPSWGTSWGLGFEVRVNPEHSLRPGAVGSYGWSGLWGTYFWIDPSARLAAMLMIQVNPDDNFGQARDALRHFTYAALAVTQPIAPTVAVSPSPALTGRYDFGRSLSARDRWGPVPGFSGLGITLSIRDERVVVQAAAELSAGYRGGVRAGDTLLEVDGTPLKGLPINEVLEKVRGAAGTPVRLRLAHRGQEAPVDLALTRQPIRSSGAQLEVRADQAGLTVEAVGPWSVLDFDKGRPVLVNAISASEFQYQGGEHTRLSFAGDRVVLNPGPWQIEGVRVRGD